MLFRTLNCVKSVARCVKEAINGHLISSDDIKNENRKLSRFKERLKGHTYKYYFLKRNLALLFLRLAKESITFLLN